MAENPPRSTIALSREQALKLARDTISNLREGHELELVEADTVETEWGWLFRYAPKRFLETGDMRFMIPGIGPFVVERDSGKTTFLSTSVPPEVALAQYERLRARRR